MGLACFDALGIFKTSRNISEARSQAFRKICTAYKNAPQWGNVFTVFNERDFMALKIDYFTEKRCM